MGVAEVADVARAAGVARPAGAALTGDRLPRDASRQPQPAATQPRRSTRRPHLASPLRALHPLLPLLPLLASAHAADWPGDSFDAPALDPAWQVVGDAKPVHERGRLVLRGDQRRVQALRRDLAGPDPDDAAPLVVTVRLDDDRRDGQPAALALGWSNSQAIAVVMDPHQGRPQAAWTTGEHVQRDGVELALDPAGGHCRLVVTARMVSAWASRDGLRFFRIAQLARGEGRFIGPPRWLSLGRGWAARPSLAENAGEQRPAQLTADALRVQRASAEAGPPPARAEGDADAVLRAWHGDPLLRGWQVLGPLSAQSKGGELTLEPGRAWPLSEGPPGPWQPVPESEVGDPSVLDVGRLAGGKREDAVFCAGVRIQTGAARDELLALDGLREVEVFLNSWPVCGLHRTDRERLLPGRHEVMLHLKPGDNDLVVRLSGGRSRARFSATRSPGDPARRAAAASAAARAADAPRASLLAQAALDWEASGSATRALATWAEVASAGDRRRAAQARARLYRQLGDRDGVLAAARDLAAAVATGERADALGDLVAAAVRAGDERALALAELAGEVTPVERELLLAGIADARGDQHGRSAALLRAAEHAGAGVQTAIDRGPAVVATWAPAAEAAGRLRLEALEPRLHGLRWQSGTVAAAVRAVLPACREAIAGFGAPAVAAAAPALDAAEAATDVPAAMVQLTRAALLAAAAGDADARALHALAERAQLGVLGHHGRDLPTLAGRSDAAIAAADPASTPLRRRAAAWLALYQACPDRPGQALDEVVRSAGALAERGDRAGALALVRLVIAVAGENPGAQVAIATTVAARLRDGDAWWLGNALVADAQRRLRRRPGDDVALRRSDAAAVLPRLALALGDGVGARDAWLALLARVQDGDAEPVLAREVAEAERQAGELPAARALAERLAATAHRDPWTREWWLQRRADWAAVRIEAVDLAFADDGATVLDTAERAAADRDLDRAAGLWQRAIAEHGRSLCRMEGGRAIAIGEFAASRLRVLATDEPGVLAAWQRQFAGEAATALARAGADRPRAGDDHALAALVRTFRFAPATATALHALAVRARDAGRWDEAAWALERLLRDHGGGATPLLALAALADAQTRAGDARRADATLADLRRHGGDARLAIAGRPVAVAAWVDAQRARLARPAPATATAARAQAIALPVQAADEAVRWGAWPHGFRLPSGRVAAAGDALLVASGDDLHALGLADGAVRWSAQRPPAVLAPRPPGVANQRGDRAERTLPALADVRPAHAAGRVFSRTGRRGAVEARALADGRLLWSSERDAALADLDIVSPPAATAGTVAALARQGDAGGRLVALAWDAASGRLRWRTPLGAAAAELRVRETAYAVGDALAAPLIADGAVLVAGLGQVAALDLVDGAVRWLATWPRPPAADGLDPRWARLLALRTPALVAGSDRLYVLPRDAVALCAFDRSDGRLLWRRPWTHERTLLGVAAASGRDLLLAQGDGLTALRAEDGATAWRWQPPSALIGDAAIAGDGILAGTAAGLWHLAGADGASRGVRPWTQLGGGPLGHLVVAGNALAGLGDPDRAPLAGVIPRFAQGDAQPPLAIDLAGGAQPLVAPGTPPPASAGTATLRWRLPAGAVGGGEIVAAAGAADGEVYARLGDALLRIDPAADRLLWRVRTTADLRALAVDGDGAALVFPGRIEGWGRADGRRRWAFALGGADGGERAARRTGALAVGDLGGVRVWAVAGDRVGEGGVPPPAGASAGPGLWFLSAADGAVRAATPLPGRAHAAAWTARGVVCVIEEGNSLALRGLDAAGAVEWKLPLGLNHNQRHDAGVLAVGDALYVASGDQAARVDLARRVVAWNVRHQAGGLGRWQVGALGNLLALIERGEFDEGHSVVLDAASGRTVARQQGAWVIEEGRMTGPQPRSGNQPPALRCLRLPDGQQLWRAPHGQDERQIHLGRWRGHLLHVVGRELVMGREGGSRRLVARLIDDASGAVVEEVDLAATQGERRLRGWEARGGWAAVAGEVLLAVADQGLHAYAAGAPEAPAPPPPQRLEPAVQTARGERAALAAAPWPAPQLAQPPDAATWAQVPARRIDRLDGLRCTAPATWLGAGDLGASVAVAWDAGHLHLRVVVDDDRVQPPPPGAALGAGDGLAIALDPEGDLGDVFAFSDHRRASRDLLLHVAGDAQSPLPVAVLGDGAGVAAAVDRRPGGLVYELSIPWRGQAPAAGARIGLGVAVLDADGATLKALELGAGLHDGLRPRRLARVQLAGLGAQRRDQIEAFLAACPDHRLAPGMVRRLAPGPDAAIAERIAWYAALLRRHAGSRLAAALLVDLAAVAGSDEARRQAVAAQVPAAVTGDALGPVVEDAGSAGPGRALAQWCWLDPARPPQGLLVRVRSRLGWAHAAAWGAVIGDDEAAPVRLGALPAAGTWVRLLLPVHALGLGAQAVQELAFASPGGRVLWGPTEAIADGTLRTLIDGALPAGAAFRGPGGWSDELPPGAVRPIARAHASVTGAPYRLATTADLVVFAEPPPPAYDARAAAELVSDAEEALELLAEAEAALPAEGRAAAAAALHLDFLRRHPRTPLAARLMQRVLIHRGLPANTVHDLALRLDDALPPPHAAGGDLLPLDLSLRRHAQGWDWGAVRGESPSFARSQRVGGRLLEGTSGHGCTVQVDIGHGQEGGNGEERSATYVLTWRADGAQLDGSYSGRARGRAVAGRLSGRSALRSRLDHAAGPLPEISDLVRLLDEIGAGSGLRRAFWRDAAPCLGPWKRLAHLDGDRASDNRAVPFPVEQGALDFARPERGIGGDVRWQDLPHDGRDLRLTASDEAINAADQWPVAYLATRFSVPARRSALLVLGWANFAVVWLNGQRLAIDEGNGEFDRERATVAVELKAGVNELLVKLLPHRGHGNFHCRLAEEDGRAVAVTTGE